MKKIFLSLILVTNIFVISAFSQTTQSETTLTVYVKGFESNVGQSLLRLFRQVDDMPTAPFMVIKANIVNKEATFYVKNLPYGDYAAIIVHDQNSNGEIDHSWGMPSEPLGFTNNWELSLFSGMPSFEKLKFSFTKTNKTLLVLMDN